MPNQIELSIIILCYRSEEAIIDFADRTRKLAEELTKNFEGLGYAIPIKTAMDEFGSELK